LPRECRCESKHNYVLGLNTYDHDVSACLLRDGAIAFAIARRVKQQEIWTPSGRS